MFEPWRDALWTISDPKSFVRTCFLQHTFKSCSRKKFGLVSAPTI